MMVDLSGLDRIEREILYCIPCEPSAALLRDIADDVGLEYVAEVRAALASIAKAVPVRVQQTGEGFGVWIPKG